MISTKNDSYMYFLNGEDLGYLLAMLDSLIVFKKIHDYGLDLKTFPSLSTEASSYYGYGNEVENIGYICNQLFNISDDDIYIFDQHCYIANEMDDNELNKINSELGDYREGFNKNLNNFEYHILLFNVFTPELRIKPIEGYHFKLITFNGNVHLNLEFLGDFQEVIDGLLSIWGKINNCEGSLDENRSDIRR